MFRLGAYEHRPERLLEKASQEGRCPANSSRGAGGPAASEVGQQVRVKLVSTNVAREFIDFVLVD